MLDLLTCLCYVFHEDRDFAALLIAAPWSSPLQSLIHAGSCRNTLASMEKGRDTPSDLGAAGGQREKPVHSCSAGGGVRAGLKQRKLLKPGTMVRQVAAPFRTLLFSSHPLVLPTPPCSPPRPLLNKLLWLEDTASNIRAAWLRAAHHIKTRSHVEQFCDTRWTAWWRPRIHISCWERGRSWLP